MTATTDIPSHDVVLTDRESGPGVLDNKWINWAGLLLVGLTIVCGLGSYVYLTGLMDLEPEPRVARLLLYANGALLLAMTALIVWQLTRLTFARRRRVAGSGLHIRIVALLSLFAVLPAIIVAAFATVTLNRGLDTWLSKRTQAIVLSAERVSEAYIREQVDIARSDVAFIANEINQRSSEFDLDRQKLIRRIATYGALRGLAGVFVMNPETRDVVISAKASNAVNFRPPPPEDLAQATTGEIVLREPVEGGNVIRGLTQLEKIKGHYLYVYRLVNPAIIRQLAEARTQRQEFNAFLEQRASLQFNFAAMYAGLALIFLLSAIWLGLLFSDRLVQPIVNLVAAARKVSAGDLSTKVDLHNTTGDLATLGRTFNQMTDKLSSQHEELTTANASLDERRRFIEAVMAGVSAGVIGLRPDGMVSLSNRSAQSLLSREEDDMAGQHVADVFPEMRAVFDNARTKVSGFAEDTVTRQVDGQERSFVVRVTTEFGNDRQPVGYVVTFDDTTELVSAQRNSAWADIARRIAHEIKNPLTPIQLSAERIRRKYGKQITGDRRVFDQCTDTIIRQVGDIGRMVDEFSAFARMPSAQLEPQNLNTIVREALVLQKASAESVRFETDLPAEAVELDLDRRLVTQAVTNLVKNALEAIEARITSKPEPPPAIRVSIARQPASVVLSVIDNGVGLPKEQRARLTEPYMTTRESGTGLGLAIVKRIMEEHGGHLSLADAPSDFHEGMGACVSLEFPLQRARESASEAADSEDLTRNDKKSGKD